MKKMIVTRENILSSVLLCERFAAVPGLRRYCSEAMVSKLIKADETTMRRIAMEAYDSIDQAVINDVQEVLGILISLSERRRRRTAELNVSVDDGNAALAGVSSSYLNTCTYRDGERIYMTWFN